MKRPLGDAVWDVIVVGGGPAGLSAALILGRCRRRVLVLDSGEYRNAAIHAMHGFLSRDGIDPAELRRTAREQLAAYDGVELRSVEAVDAEMQGGHFDVSLADGSTERTRKLLLATGMSDELPPIPGIRAFYGTSVFHCPYCDGWEARDRPVSVYGCGEKGVSFAQTLSFWTRDLTLVTDGGEPPDDAGLKKLAARGIALKTEPIERLVGDAGRLQSLLFSDGSRLESEFLFFCTGKWQRSGLPEKLGCKFLPGGDVATRRDQSARQPGLFVAGDAAEDLKLAIVAAAEGAKAAFSVHSELMNEDLGEA